MGTRRQRWGAAGLSLALGGGCYVGLGPAASSDGDEPVVESDDAGPEGGETGEDPDGPADAGCQQSGAAVLRYLTRDEYRNTIVDLLGDGAEVADAFPSDEEAGGFGANALHAPSSTQVEMFFGAAQDLATIAVGERLDRFVSCQPADPGCADAFITAFGRLAFRRPLTETEVSEYGADFSIIEAEQGALLGLEVVAAAMLASPHFLYIAHDDVASRLSYFLWSTMPDEALLDAAEAGELQTPEGMRAQVNRMLADERAAAMLSSFATQWLEVDHLDTVAKDHGLFPSWNADVADGARRETAALMTRVVLEDDARLSSVLLSRRAWVDADLAALYGVEPSDPAGGWVDLPEGERAGVLTRAAFLANHAHAGANSWVFRGKVVRERLLCDVLPAPPDIADDSPINDDARLENPQCAGCHTLMDPIGVGFDDYDPIGRFVGDGQAGEVVGLPEPGFGDVRELSALLAGSEEVHACFARQMFAYANRREVGSEDACALDSIVARFIESDGDVAQLVIELATSDAFRGGEVD